MPGNYDPFNVEAVHLIHHADSDMVSSNCENVYITECRQGRDIQL